MMKGKIIVVQNKNTGVQNKTIKVDTVQLLSKFDDKLGFDGVKKLL